MAIVERRKKDGSITFQVKVLDREGKWFPTSSFEHLDQAQKEEARLNELKRKGAKAMSEDARIITVDEYWEVWSVENRSKVSEGWKISQNQMYRDYVKPIIGDETMINVNPPLIGKALNEMQRKGLSDQMRKHVYTLMRTMFSDAVEYYEMLTISPVRAKFHRPRVPKAKRNFLLPAQAFHLMEACKDSYLGPAVWLGLLSALRISEIQALRGSSLQFALNQILVCAAYNAKEKRLQDHPKQEDWAYVPMPPMLKRYLMQLNVGPDEFVAPGPNGGMLSYSTFLPSLKRLCRKSGVQVITPHELRHSSTEIYIQAGASREDIRRLLNHASDAATGNYIHRTDERLNMIAEGLGPKVSFPEAFPFGKKEADNVLVEGAPLVH